MAVRDPEMAFGIMVYNQAHHLERSLQSILAQSFSDFRLVAIDDNSADDSFAILERYAKLDPRLQIHRNQKRIGYVRNARQSYALCRDGFPSLQFFAWASDHDVLHPNWLELHIAALKAEPDAALAYSWHQVIDANGSLIHPRALRAADRSHSRDARARMIFAVHEVPAGALIYGLFRMAALRKTSGICPVMAPDALLIAELALAGSFVCIQEFLWHRRYFRLFSVKRQRRNSFPDGAPLHTYLPTTVQHTSILVYDLFVRRLAESALSRWQAGLLALTFIAARQRNEWRRMRRQRNFAKTKGAAPWSRRLKRFRNIASKKGAAEAVARELRSWLSTAVKLLRGRE